ncbi:MAG: hypothetical protein WC479_07540 [Candidatus Izemoplasmatales bacterium]|jgi:hypothetical protein
MEHSFEDYPSVKSDPSLLLHSNIPKPLHEVNPRTIKGQEWWDKERRLTYEAQGDRCAACGTHKSQAKGKKKWLECHEVYEIDYAAGRAIFVKLVALCPYCHSFIHNGRLQALFDKGEITTKEYFAVINHGKEILEKHNLFNQWEHRHDVLGKIAEWEDWRLVFEGLEYPPKFKSYEEWLANFGYHAEMTPKGSPLFHTAHFFLTEDDEDIIGYGLFDML